MISNTDSTLLVYSTEHMRVKVYKGRGPRQRFQSACGDAPSDAFWRVRFRAPRAPAASALRRGQRVPPPFPPPLLPLGRSFSAAPLAKFYLRKPTLKGSQSFPANPL